MSEENIRSEDLIELPGLKRIAIQFLRGLFGVFNFMADSVKHRKALIAVGFLVGLICGYAYHKTNPPQFEVTMLVESSTLHKGTVSELMNELNFMVKTSSFKKLAEALALTEPESRQISTLGTFTVNNESLENDTSSRLHDPFKITAKLKDVGLSGKVQTGIINYVNNKPTLRKRKDDFRAIYSEQLAFIQIELAKLDSLKKEYTHFIASAKMSAAVNNNAFDPASLFTQSSALMTQKEAILIWLSKDAESITLLDEFKGTVSPQSASLRMSLLASAALGVLACMLLSLILEINQKLKKYT